MRANRLTRMKRVPFEFIDTEKVEISEDSGRFLVLSVFEGILLKRLGCYAGEMKFRIYSPCREIEIEFETDRLDNTDLAFLVGMADENYMEPEDGDPRIEVDVVAKGTKEYVTENNKWMEDSDNENVRNEWETVWKDYEYDGNLTVRITIEFSVNDWNKYRPEVKTE